jgi:hypothetical protein
MPAPMAAADRRRGVKAASVGPAVAPSAVVKAAVVSKVQLVATIAAAPAPRGGKRGMARGQERENVAPGSSATPLGRPRKSAHGARVLL